MPGGFFGLLFAGASFGVLAAAGVFTVFTAVGLIPRFAGKTHTAKRILLYEEMVIWGTILGAFASIFPEYSQMGAFFQRLASDASAIPEVMGVLLQGTAGLFAGMFVGCLALAIAEMLDSIPIFARRISLRHGIGMVIFSMALGKLGGSLWYFVNELHRVAE